MIFKLNWNMNQKSKIWKSVFFFLFKIDCFQRHRNHFALPKTGLQNPRPDEEAVWGPVRFSCRYYVKIEYFNEYFESGSTARNASARISTARHFFWKSHLLDRKMSTAQQKKYAIHVPRVNFEQLIKKLNCSKFWADDKIIETVKYKSSIFFI